MNSDDHLHRFVTPNNVCTICGFEAPPLPIEAKRHRHDWYTHEYDTPCYGVEGEIWLDPGVIHCRSCFQVKRGQPVVRRNISETGQLRVIRLDYRGPELRTIETGQAPWLHGPLESPE